MASMMMMSRSIAMKALGGPSSSFLSSFQRCRFPTIKAFSALMSPLSKAIVYDQQGPPDSVTRVVEIPPVKVKENDVCVRMLASPINPSNINRIESRILDSSVAEIVSVREALSGS